MDRVDVLVIGAGVIGLACARALAQAGLEVVIAEREPRWGSGVSSRNSEVVHAGIYYPSGSLKAQLCVAGREMLYAFCAARGVAVQRCGKLVVATREQDLPALARLAEQGQKNGVADLALLSREQALALEPALDCVAALHSPSSGIVDSHGLMSALLGDAQAAGANLACASRFLGAQRDGVDWRVQIGTASEPPFELRASWIVNAAGLEAQAVAQAIEGFPAGAIPKRHLAKGHYFALSARAPFTQLIYPLPVDGGLGVHLTLDLAGQAKFGPDVHWLAHDDVHLNYEVDASLAPAFEAEVRRYWPGLPERALAPSYAGIRPKLSGPGESPADFCIAGPAQHGCAGVVQLFGIESPGLTASLAIAQLLAELIV